jgi:molybdate transport system substrate-binding protein
MRDRGASPLRAVVAAVTVGVVSRGAAAQAQGDLAVFAAGSLRAPLTEIAQAFEQAHAGQRVVLTFGASGLLKDRIASGEHADVFASANMEHPQALAAAGKAAPVTRFARNALCAIAAPGVAVTSNTLVERMLDPQVKLGTSTPKADPSGDYAWMMFERIEEAGSPGAFKTLSEKARQLTGSPKLPPPPAGRNAYAALVSGGQADIFITYCTNAKAAAAEVPTLRVVDVPARINVSADYGVTRTLDAVPLAADFVSFLLGREGQSILARHGFAPA